MKNASVQANGEAMSAVTRRSFLATTAGAGAAVVAAGGAASAEAMPDEKSSAINALLADYLAEMRNFADLSKRTRAAEERLPEWAQPGLELMSSDGSKGGALVGWPERAVLPTPDPEATSIRYTIRPSPRGTWKHHMTLIGSRETWMRGRYAVGDGGVLIPAQPTSEAWAKRRQQRLEAIRAVRAVIARVREQREEKRKVGLPELKAAYDASYKRGWVLEAQLLSLADGTSPAELAVHALFEFKNEENEFPLTLLWRLAPQLAGLLRVVVNDVLANGADGIDHTMLRGMPQGGPPAVSPDPMLALICEYRDGLATFSASGRLSWEQDEALEATTWGPAYRRLSDAPPVPTSLAGAVEAIRLVAHEEERCGGQEDLTVNVLKAALAYFEGRSA